MKKTKLTINQVIHVVKANKLTTYGELQYLIKRFKKSAIKKALKSYKPKGDPLDTLTLCDIEVLATLVDD
jgi:response regulator of citrate/malate metabolism